MPDLCPIALSRSLKKKGSNDSSFIPFRCRKNNFSKAVIKKKKIFTHQYLIQLENLELMKKMGLIIFL